jgi:hypothetical protein
VHLCVILHRPYVARRCNGCRCRQGGLLAAGHGCQYWRSPGPQAAPNVWQPRCPARCSSSSCGGGEQARGAAAPAARGQLWAHIACRERIRRRTLAVSIPAT